MNQKQRIFIYDRKEMAVLLLLGVMVAVFAFTLGVHLGKRVGGKAPGAPAAETAPVATIADKTPDGKDLADQTKNAAQAADDTLDQSLHDEVQKTGLKLDTSHPVDLPKDAKSANAGATTLKTAAEIDKPADEETSAPVTAKKIAPGHYTLQVGSYPQLKEARSRADEIRGQGLAPTVQEAEIQGKGRWYRIYIGEFPTKFEAEKAGEHYQAERLIDSFVVAKLATTVAQ